MDDGRGSTEDKAMQTLNHHEVARLAYEFWERRGRPHGSPEVDWCQAEKQLWARSRGELHLGMGQLSLEPETGPWRDPNPEHCECLAR